MKINFDNFDVNVSRVIYIQRGIIDFSIVKLNI